MKKSIFKSKTFWFNIGVTAGSAIAPLVISGLEQYAWGGIAIGLINIALRKVTKVPVGLHGEVENDDGRNFYR